MKRHIATRTQVPEHLGSPVQKHLSSHSKKHHKVSFYVPISFNQDYISIENIIK